jgi:hypothetical protein
MSLIRKLHNRFLVFIVFALTCTRVIATRARSSGGSTDASHQRVLATNFTQSLLVRFPGRPARGFRQRGLQLGGAFPYIRLASLSSSSVRLPVELAALSTPAGSASLDLHVSSPGTGTDSSSVAPPFLSGDCGSCSSCAGCINCGCSCATCGASCESCGDCGSGCGSCGSCTGSCSSCGGCASCGSCAGCGSCGDCGGCG